MMQSKRSSQYRFGIAEWYGHSFVQLPFKLRREFAKLQDSRSYSAETPPCPFLSTGGNVVRCWKKGGVCSLRSYERTADGKVILNSRGSSIRTTCPSRFQEGGIIYQWIGEVVLEDANAVPIGQINFLERVPLIGGGEEETASDREVGRIDNVLVVPASEPLKWCPVEIQAVYFSGANMGLDFKYIRRPRTAQLPFPQAVRRPDYRSSAPKRLMPQLQIKVPTLRRWGKKMAVVIDEDFFNAMGKMETVDDLSNCDVAWFVLRYSEDANGHIRLQRKQCVFTTLETSVAGLIAGRPVTQSRFQEKILEKLAGRG